MPLSALVAFLFAISNYSVSENLNYKIEELEVFKRNKASCIRLGNIYDACQWMTKVVVRNLGQKEISQFCLFMKVNKKTYELCYGKTKKLLIESNGKSQTRIAFGQLLGLFHSFDNSFWNFSVTTTKKTNSYISLI